MLEADVSCRRMLRQNGHCAEAVSEPDLADGGLWRGDLWRGDLWIDERDDIVDGAVVAAESSLVDEPSLIRCGDVFAAKRWFSGLTVGDMVWSANLALFRPTPPRFEVAVADLGRGSETDTEPDPVVPVPLHVVLANLVVVEVAALSLLSNEL